MGEGYKVCLSPRAVQDLEGISDYVHERSPQGARGLIERVLDAIEELHVMPSSFRVVGKSRTKGTPVRAFAVGSLIVFYRVEERPPAVEILTIRHAKRRQPRRFE